MLMVVGWVSCLEKVLGELCRLVSAVGTVASPTTDGGSFSTFLPREVAQGYTRECTGGHKLWMHV